MNFIALGVISEIDDYYAESFSDFEIAKSIEENPPIIKISSK